MFSNPKKKLASTINTITITTTIKDSKNIENKSQQVRTNIGDFNKILSGPS